MQVNNMHLNCGTAGGYSGGIQRVEGSDEIVLICLFTIASTDRGDTMMSRKSFFNELITHLKGKYMLFLFIKIIKLIFSSTIYRFTK